MHFWERSILGTHGLLLIPRDLNRRICVHMDDIAARWYEGGEHRPG